MKAFLQAYIVCALWSSMDENDEPLYDNYSADDLAPETLTQMEEDCQNFLDLLENEGIVSPGDEEQNGHDFWLTRNGHGAGFWDRGYGKVGDELTKWAKTFGSCDLHVGDDGKLYI